ncbi:antitoxin [uncultured Ruminococcus sp.]|uniref:antitoxin n=1 Tax=uncultured Ruminococcus sp. TaxID=165186 RepID=UPI00260D4F50|nr:antitoxin [uncultured Ruminococcus sp.]
MDKQKQIIRQNKYVAEKYDRFTATFPKGKKEEYRVHAEKKGLSLNGLINELIEDDIAKDKNE